MPKGNSDNIDPKKVYSFEEALTLAKEASKEKFESSIEVHIKLGIDPSKGDQQVRSVAVLPHGTGKTRKVTVFSGDEGKLKEAKDAGADQTGGEELIAEVKQKGSLDTDVVIATPEIMPKLAQVAKILGPRGLMPSPKNETITQDVAKAVGEMQGGKIAFKNDDTANVHQVIGKTVWDAAKLTENYTVFLDAITKAKPTTAKGSYIKNISISTTMGPGIKVSV